MKTLYFDNNATTALDPIVRDAIIEELNQAPSNPSSIHTLGRAARARLEEARARIATYCKAHPKEIIFTSGGTEGVHLAILGHQPKGSIITSSTEHSCVHNLLESLPGCEITQLPTGPHGHISLSDLEKELRPTTQMIVIGAINSETGVKNPIPEIASLAKAHSIPFIVDGVALMGKEPLHIPQGVAAMAFSAHKFHGPKGVGFLFARKKTPLTPLFHGGGQEHTLRSGTENLPGIIGLATAVSLLEGLSHEMEPLRDAFEAKILSSIPKVRINGTGPRICNTSNLTFPNIDGEALFMQLDLQGLCASMGSACSSGAIEPSRTLLSMGLSKKDALSSLRFSLSRFTTEEEVQRAAEIVISSYRALHR